MLLDSQHRGCGFAVCRCIKHAVIHQLFVEKVHVLVLFYCVTHTLQKIYYQYRLPAAGLRGNTKDITICFICYVHEIILVEHVSYQKHLEEHWTDNRELLTPHRVYIQNWILKTCPGAGISC